LPSSAAWGVKGGKSFCRDTAGGFLLPLALRAGEGIMEPPGPPARLEFAVSRLAKVGCALRPTAQSGRGGSGCCEDAVEVYVLREEELVDDD